MKEKGIHYLDVGTSGGIWGLTEGYCLMVGGDADAFAFCEPVFRTLAPPDGYLHVGPSGAGHYVKMVHNGIEYAMMQAYAEGFEILKASDLPARFARDLQALGARHGHPLVAVGTDDAALCTAIPNCPASAPTSRIRAKAAGRWRRRSTAAVPAHTIAAALFARFASRQDNAFGLRLLAALRNEFGGHPVMTAEGMTPKAKTPKPDPAPNAPPIERINFLLFTVT